jgi:hypothetical protein
VCVVCGGARVAGGGAWCDACVCVCVQQQQQQQLQAACWRAALDLVGTKKLTVLLYSLINEII